MGRYQGKVVRLFSSKKALEFMGYKRKPLWINSMRMRDLHAMMFMGHLEETVLLLRGAKKKLTSG